MADRTERRARSFHPGGSAIAALLVGVVATVLSVAVAVEAVLYSEAQTARSTDVLSSAGPAALVSVQQALTTFGSLTVAVFLSFWLIAPLRGRQRLGSAIIRSLIAALIGVTVASVVAGYRIVDENAVALNPAVGLVDSKVYLLLIGTIADQSWRITSTTAALVLAAGLGLWGHLARTRGRGEIASAGATADQPIHDQRAATGPVPTPQYSRTGAIAVLPDSGVLERM